MRGINNKDRVGETRVQDGVRTYVVRSGCTLGVEMPDEFSEESLLLERSPLDTDVEKCFDDGSLERAAGVVGAGAELVVGEGVGDDVESREEWFEKYELVVMVSVRVSDQATKKIARAGHYVSLVSFSMKLMLRQEWRLWPLSSFLGFVDIKTGVTVALLFAVRFFPSSQNAGIELVQVLNKVAGVYGLIAVLTGAGGSFAQLSLYIYSVVALIALVWGLRAVKNVRPWSSTC